MVRRKFKKYYKIKGLEQVFKVFKKDEKTKYKVNSRKEIETVLAIKKYS